MKKIVAIILSIIVCCVTFSGCSKTAKIETSELDERFLILSDTNSGLGYRSIIVDKETGVMYLFVGSKTRGGLTVMVDAEGNPLIYNGEYDE